jgi:hypothetical protein
MQSVFRGIKLRKKAKSGIRLNMKNDNQGNDNDNYNENDYNDNENENIIKYHNIKSKKIV